MTWLIIILVVALVLGPIAYLMPTAREKRQGALRERARALGLQVKFSEFIKFDPEPHERVSAGGKVQTPKVACIAYRLPHELAPEQAPSPVVLVREPAQPTIPMESVLSGWALDATTRQGWEALSARYSPEQLAAHLQGMPLEVQAWSVDERFVACLWQENVAADSPLIDQLSANLQGWAAFLRTNQAQ